MSDQSEPTKPDLTQGVAVDGAAKDGLLLGRVGDDEVLLARANGEWFAVGASCTQNSGCRTGLSCVVQTGSATGTGACRPVCSLASPSCPSGTTCHAFNSSTRVLYGFCQ